MGLRDLLGDILTYGASGMYKPEANPNLSFDKSGNPIDAQTGKALTSKQLMSAQYAPYTQPSWNAMAFSPEARQIAAMNAQAEAQPTMEGRQAMTQRLIGEQQSINPILNTLNRNGINLTPDQWYALIGSGTHSAAQIGGEQTGLQNIQQGVPSTIAQMQQEQAALGERQAGRALRLDPERGATEAIQTGLQNKGAQLEQELFPTKASAARGEAAQANLAAHWMNPMPYYSVPINGENMTAGGIQHNPFGATQYQLMYGGLMNGGLNSGFGNTKEVTLPSSQIFRYSPPNLNYNIGGNSIGQEQSPMQSQPIQQQGQQQPAQSNPVDMRQPTPTARPLVVPYSLSNVNSIPLGAMSNLPRRPMYPWEQVPPQFQLLSQ